MSIREKKQRERERGEGDKKKREHVVCAKLGDGEESNCFHQLQLFWTIPSLSREKQNFIYKKHL